MLKLAQTVGESEPEQAERLRDALQRTGEREVGRRLETIVGLLRDAQFSAADAEQRSVVQELEAILTLLTEKQDQLEQMRAERERLARLRQALQQLQTEQIETLQRTRAAQQMLERAQRLAAEAEALRKLAQEQAELRQQTDEAPSAEAKKAEAQEKLAAESRAAAEQLKRATDAPEDDQRLRQQAARDAEQAAKAMQSAAEAMRATESEAEARNSAKQRDAQQQKASEALQRAIRRLEQQAEALQKRANVRPIERQQRGHAEQAESMEQQMRPDGDEAPLPSEQSMKRARSSMQRAADRLGEQDANSAEQEQQEAIESLQDAMEQIEDVLRQVREEELEETLTALETRFKRMLQHQETLLEDVSAFQARVDALSRDDRVSIRELAAGQLDMVEECRQVRRLLLDEGTTVILPELVAELAADMDGVRANLEAVDVSAATTTLLEDVIAAIREILGAIEQKREQMNNQPSGEQDGPGNSVAALLPGSAELKLLRASQVRINDRTKQYAEANRTQTERYRTLAKRQARLTTMARQMNERR